MGQAICDKAFAAILACLGLCSCSLLMGKRLFVIDCTDGCVDIGKHAPQSRFAVVHFQSGVDCEEGLVALVLPAMFLIFDKVICKTSINFLGKK